MKNFIALPLLLIFVSVLLLISVSNSDAYSMAGKSWLTTTSLIANPIHHLFPDSTKKAGPKDQGIGPFKGKNVDLGAINQKWVSEGKSIFSTKCVLCHELDQKKIGPPLRNITKERTPQYIMNMVVNPTKMQKEDPDVKLLIKKYNNVLMTELGISNDQARSVLEYLRSSER